MEIHFAAAARFQLAHPDKVKECLLWAEAGKRKAKKQLSLLGILPGETPQLRK